MQKEKLGVLVSYKDRPEHLEVFIPYFNYFMETTHPDIDYQIYIIEQANDKPFNKGIIFNAGFDLTNKYYDYLTLHDIDMLPISANYYYNSQSYHLPSNIYNQHTNGRLDEFYTNKIGTFNGGVIVIDNEQYNQCNGHSNNYWGWGSVDDDFALRLSSLKKPLINRCLKIEHNIILLGYYVTLHHDDVRFDDEPFNDINLERLKNMNSNKLDFKKDGLSSLKYKLLNTEDKKEYIKYSIDF